MLRFTRDSKTLLSAFAALAAVLVFLGFIFPLSLRSQEKGNPPTVNSISVLIDGQPASPELLELVPIREGDLFSLNNISDSIRKIFKTGLFLDIQVEKQGEDDIDLFFILTKQFFIRKIVYFGGSDIPRKLLDEGLYALSGGSPFSVDRLSKAMDELRAVLKKEGYPHASIDTHTEKDETTSQIDVLFHIDAGTRYRIEKITFKGDILVSESELIEKMETRERKTFIPSKLENDIKRIKEIYHAMDYRNVEITVEDEIFDDAAQTLVLTLRIGGLMCL
jgi:outer membrane protein insertion porin family